MIFRLLYLRYKKVSNINNKVAWVDYLMNISCVLWT